MKHFKFPDGVTAWSEINKMFLNQEPTLFESGQGAVITGSLYTYGLTIEIEDAKFDPDFDFGKIKIYPGNYQIKILDRKE